MMENEFVPYEQALDLKKLGFDEPCFGTYNFRKDLYYFPITNGLFKNSDIKHKCYKHLSDRISSPLYQQAFKFFRDKYKLDKIIYFNGFNINNKKCEKHVYEIYGYKTYEQCKLECLKKLIEIVKNKK